MGVGVGVGGWVGGCGWVAEKVRARLPCSHSVCVGVWVGRCVAYISKCVL